MEKRAYIDPEWTPAPEPRPKDKAKPVSPSLEELDQALTKRASEHLSRRLTPPAPCDD